MKPALAVEPLNKIHIIPQPAINESLCNSSSTTLNNGTDLLDKVWPANNKNKENEDFIYAKDIIPLLEEMNKLHDDNRRIIDDKVFALFKKFVVGKEEHLKIYKDDFFSLYHDITGDSFETVLTNNDDINNIGSNKYNPAINVINNPTALNNNNNNNSSSSVSPILRSPFSVKIKRMSVDLTELSTNILNGKNNNGLRPLSIPNKENNIESDGKQTIKNRISPSSISEEKKIRRRKKRHNSTDGVFAMPSYQNVETTKESLQQQLFIKDTTIKQLQSKINDLEEYKTKYFYIQREFEFYKKLSNSSPGKNSDDIPLTTDADCSYVNKKFIEELTDKLQEQYSIIQDLQQKLDVPDSRVNLNKIERNNNIIDNVFNFVISHFTVKKMNWDFYNDNEYSYLLKNYIVTPLLIIIALSFLVFLTKLYLFFMNKMGKNVFEQHSYMESHLTLKWWEKSKLLSKIYWWNKDYFSKKSDLKYYEEFDNSKYTDLFI
ncbi:uncharacterized protein SCODWIG_03053 [Saccharomycodes ludwigii]|uniref:Monopolar spindle protein 2 n=1 Tax=Saccharomycodes ludwigii TaxID=36035 RepID=A0A376B9G4_9ASCO|nr:hypothetical protein SCDLUD_001097 [Saccharomycodes ludwigii]KAH3903457.1 hypothetical protein SCDLUD_001097 [Saccharomycodes ludwigii]SSD61292.1 uncharacterized protein SCODWIG_03053 [Saccharomycodes ludwigii]